jgi:hypothetical protein
MAEFSFRLPSTFAVCVLAASSVLIRATRARTGALTADSGKEVTCAAPLMPD